MRWGFLGASRIGRRALAPAIEALGEGHMLQAVAARDPVRARAYAEECGFAEALDNYEAVIASPEVDCVYIALTNDAHLPWTMRALAAGKHVLCEKPLSLDAREAAEIAGAEAAGSARVMEAFCHIHHPQFTRARAAFAEALGTVRAIEANFSAMIEPNDDYRWHARHGGGALLDVGTYVVSLVRLLVGREPVRAAAVAQWRGDVDETFAGLLDFGDGLALHFACSLQSDFGQRLEAIGTTGRLAMDWPFSTKGRETRLTVSDAVETFEMVDPYVLMLRDFVAGIETGMPFLFPITHSVRQAVVLDALLRAAREERTLEIGSATG